MKIPYRSQNNHFYCAPASLQMLFEFFGVYKTQNDIAKKLNTNPQKGTEDKSIIDFVTKQGFFCYVNQDSTLEEIDDFIKKGHPVIVNFIEPSQDEGHYALVVGMDEEEIILNDPWNGKGFKMTKKDFKKRWHNSDNRSKRWMMVISRENFNLGKQFLAKEKL
ncbi:MAG: C39 family peptidase [Patescibacteria group bacterium]|nr:C39 family peptidase [Patescibacteria group bacterium]